jgi:hypothetical protein
MRITFFIAAMLASTAQAQSLNRSQCLAVDQDKHDKMVIRNNCGAPVNVVYCWKGGGGDKSKYSCAGDGYTRRIDKGKRIGTRGEPKGESRLMYFACKVPAKPRFVSTAGDMPDGTCSKNSGPQRVNS